MPASAGEPFTDPQRDAFAVTERIALRFALADRVLISTPMWNFGIPYKLKQWIDVITQPGLAFRSIRRKAICRCSRTGRRSSSWRAAAISSPA